MPRRSGPTEMIVFVGRLFLHKTIVYVVQEERWEDAVPHVYTPFDAEVGIFYAILYIACKQRAR